MVHRELPVRERTQRPWFSEMKFNEGEEGVEEEEEEGKR